MVTGLQYQWWKRDTKSFGTIAIPYITTTLKAGFLFRNVLLLLYQFSGRGLNYNGTPAVGFGICKEDQVDRLDDQILIFRLRNPLSGGGGSTGIPTRGAIMVRYTPWELLIILSSVKFHCLVFHIIVSKNIYALSPRTYIFKSPMDWIPNPALDL